MSRNFKQIPDAQMADYGSPRRLAQERYNGLVQQYQQEVENKRRTDEKMVRLSQEILMWRNADRALRGI